MLFCPSTVPSVHVPGAAVSIFTSSSFSTGFPALSIAFTITLPLNVSLTITVKLPLPTSFQLDSVLNLYCSLSTPLPLSSANAFTNKDVLLYHSPVFSGEIYGALLAVLSVFHAGSAVSTVTPTDCSATASLPTASFAFTVNVHAPSFVPSEGIVKLNVTSADFLSVDGVFVITKSEAV